MLTYLYSASALHLSLPISTLDKACSVRFVPVETTSFTITESSDRVQIRRGLKVMSQLHIGTLCPPFTMNSSENSSGSCDKIPVLDTSILHNRENTKNTEWSGCFAVRAKPPGFQDGIPLHSTPNSWVLFQYIRMFVY